MSKQLTTTQKSKVVVDNKESTPLSTSTNGTKLKSTAKTRQDEAEHYPSIKKKETVNVANYLKNKNTTISNQTKMSTTATTAVTQKLKLPKTLTSTVPVAARKKISSNQSNITLGNKPMRGTHDTPQITISKKNNNTVNKKNQVLDTYHNVTVTSPPRLRKQQQGQLTSNEKASKPFTPTESPTKKLIRKHSRILEPEEIIILKRESAKKRIEQEILAEQKNQQTERTVVKEPVSFEVSFDEVKASTSRKGEKSQQRGIPDHDEPHTDIDYEETNYSDDFESYESDFETGSSSPPIASESESEKSNDEQSDHSYGSYCENESEKNAKSIEKHLPVAGEVDVDEDVTEDDSELTQNPITVIPQRQKEHKLDSGNYEISSGKNIKLSEMSAQSSAAVSSTQFDSFDTFSMNTSEQLDSGISTYENQLITSPQHKDQYNTVVFYGGYSDFNTKPVINKRGRDLMSKIQFDCLTFTLFDMKPINYDVYMRTYGKLNTTQTSSQTNDDQISADCQTDKYKMRTIWTQHPPVYDLQTVQSLGYGLSGSMTVENYYGEEESEDNVYEDSNVQKDEFDISMEALDAFQQSGHNRRMRKHLQQLSKPIDFEKLNRFLLNAAKLMTQVLNSKQTTSNAQSHKSIEYNTFSEGYSLLDTRFLNTLRVIRIFANPRHNLIITVHECLPDVNVYRSEFANLLMVWSITECNKPLRLLSSWSEVSHVEICYDTADIIVCGLHDGSVALWDLRETYSFCSKLDGYLSHFAATQSIVPIYGDNVRKTDDLGAVVNIRSFRTPATPIGTSMSMTGYKTIQFVSLNETGILVVWTLVETRPNDLEAAIMTKQRSPRTPNVRFEYSSPWARVKLIQSAICQLCNYLERNVSKTQSQFDKTKTLFEKNIYNDDVLRELNQRQRKLQFNHGTQGLRFTSISVGIDLIYVCTNQNYIIVCTKSLKCERFRKIFINESRFLFPTALCVLCNEDFLAVGLSNGSVIILNCSLRRIDTLLRQHDELQVVNDNQAPATAGGNDGDIGKSCAIQNIIMNERRTENCIDEYGTNNLEYEHRPNTAAYISLISNKKKPFELRIYDQQIILSGSVLRKDLIKNLELSSDGWRLFALSNGILRTYDFYLERELVTQTTAESTYKIIDIAVARCNHQQKQQHLLLLNSYNDVEVHLLKE